MNYRTEIILSCAQFDELSKGAPVEVVADVETFGEGPQSESARLLGIGVAFAAQDKLSGCQPVAFYVPFWEWDASHKVLLPVGEAGLAHRVSSFLRDRNIIGHNIEHDRIWIDRFFGIKSEWKADTRKMWHLSDDKDSLHGFGLKTAQIEVLGWERSNDEELEKVVSERGGKLSNGDHYLAPVGILGRYACLDGISTWLLYDKLRHFFDRNNYWHFLEWRQNYHRILTEASERGTPVDVNRLVEAREELAVKCEEAEKKIREVCKAEVESLEEAWAKEKAKSYKRSVNGEAYLASPLKWKRFNPNSSLQRTILFHETLGLPVLQKTPTGRPKSDRDTIASLGHPASDAFVELSEFRKLFQFANSYIESLRETKSGHSIHFPYDTSATVSDRLGGFKPYALNMPFSEASLMSAFKVEAGFIGIHADLAAVEPCLIAAYSEDPTLLKVHRDGLGDVYLDFALQAFPENLELHAAYNPLAPLTPEIKKRFKKKRDVCKTVHLAVGYTGTWSTVFKNLRKQGFDIDQNFARLLVNRYWAKFEAVLDFDYRLRRLHEKQGSLRNLFGRIIKVPENRKKDIMNRFIQSSGHDCLTAWVMEIDRLRREEPEIGMYPILPDIHDSTSWAVKEQHYERARGIFEEALRVVNSRLDLPVTLRAEIKPFRTFFGLKGDEG